MVLRRERAAMVMLTLMLAGVNVFALDVLQMANKNTYLPASYVRSIQRESGRNLIGDTRFNGLVNGNRSLLK